MITAFQKMARFETVLLCLVSTLPLCLHGATISGVVKDPSGAVIPEAQIEIKGGDLAQPVVIVSDGLGKFTSSDLKPGKYVLRVSKDGFEPQEKSVDLKNGDLQKGDLQAATEVEFTLAIATQQATVLVPGKSLQFANTDPVYRQLRGIGLGDTFVVEDFTVPGDVATFQFRKGTLTFLSPVEGVVTGMIFIGDGHFNLKAATPLNERELTRRTGESQVNEDFSEGVFRFSGEIRKFLNSGLGKKVDMPSEAASVFRSWQEKVRRRHEVPEGLSQGLLEGDTMDNVDADILAAIYNPAHPGFFNAYIRGKKHKDLRFFFRARVGAIPELDSAEEVALINYEPGGMEDGIWYLDHMKAEYAKHQASSLEDRRLFATHRYKIETVIAKNDHLYGRASIAFEPVVKGERVLKFGLLPSLRVTRVTDEQAQDLYFIQETRKADGSFYVVLPKAPDPGKELSITVEYAGDKVLQDAGSGSFYVQARTSWYPNLNGFGERALYDLTFKVPHKYKVISVGKLQGESREQDFAVTHWVTPIPVAVAGFNYGEYQKIELPDEKDGYGITGYYLTELPDQLRPYRDSAALQSMSPTSMTKYALEQTRAQLQLCSYYFGKSPFDSISITEQPDFSFGQSWPNLVYLPISAYIDSTQRWMLFGRIDNKFSGFVSEVTPHEVAHQWWGHTVGWASYHDQWLSEGFAEFSAGLFLQQAVGKNWQKDYIEFWERQRKRILEKNSFGVAPNDAGPLWMGLRLDAPNTANAYQNVTYPKGAYVLAMLRSIMYDNETHDKAFIEMMHDFVEQHRENPACTESFKAVVEKHIPKSLDLQGNGSMNWFFHEWVYDTRVPRYHFEYQLAPADGGKTKLHYAITQSEVDENFAMPVPIFADFGHGMMRLGQAVVVGNSTRSGDVLLPAQPKKVELNAYKEILER